MLFSRLRQGGDFAGMLPLSLLPLRVSEETKTHQILVGKSGF